MPYEGDLFQISCFFLIDKKIKKKKESKPAAKAIANLAVTPFVKEQDLKKFNDKQSLSGMIHHEVSNYMKGKISRKLGQFFTFRRLWMLSYALFYITLIYCLMILRL